MELYCTSSHIFVICYLGKQKTTVSFTLVFELFNQYNIYPWFEILIWKDIELEVLTTVPIRNVMLWNTVYMYTHVNGTPRYNGNHLSSFVL